MRMIFSLFLTILYVGNLISGSEEIPHHSDHLSIIFDEVASPDTLIKMERTICYGTCPSYTLSILENGKVNFNGREYVAHEGEATGMMSQENLDELTKMIRQSHFMEIPSNPECKSRMTDHPSIFLTIRLDDKQHGITHYQGCKGFQYEEELYDLEESIDSLSGAEKWVEGEG